MEPHQTFWKPEKKPKEKKSNSLGRSKREKKPVPEHKQKLLEHHKAGKGSARRAEFPAAVVKELIKESDGQCQCCKVAPDTTTHHVMPRGRRGRGVKTNGLRLCGICHDNIQTDEEQLQYWISVFRERHGDYFWFDETDWNEYAHKQSLQQQAERDKEERLKAIEPVADLFSTAAGRMLREKEMKFLDSMSTDDLKVFTGMMTDALNGYAAHGSFRANDRFDD